MKRLMLASLSVMPALLFLLLISSVARAEETTCQGSLGAVTVDNLRVPQNASCTLDGTRVEGTLKVENNASLTATQVTVIGNIQAEGAARVRVLAGSIISGSVQIKQGGAAELDAVRVVGDIQFESNTQALSATRSRVGGNVQSFQNMGGVVIADNDINGNLQCKENDPAPTGENNLVQGNAEDQCAHLNEQTRIDSGPSAATTATSATFVFSANEPGAAFECALDEAAFTACASPVEFVGLAIGSHVFRVRATGVLGNVDPTPATYSWTVLSAQRVYLPLIHISPTALRETFLGRQP
jgi:hypothetical protein